MKHEKSCLIVGETITTVRGFVCLARWFFKGLEWPFPALDTHTGGENHGKF